LNDRLHRLVAALLESAEYGHQDRLRIGADFAPVAVAVLADDHCRTHLALGVVVVEGDSIVIEKRKQVGLVLSQALDQSPRLAVAPGRLEQRLQALRQRQPRAPRGVRFGGQLPAQSPKPDRVAQESPQQLRKRRPVVGDLGTVSRSYCGS